jgi:replicative DNA helicase
VEIFDERLFIRALTVRPEDARIFAGKFRPEWLQNATYRPILAEISSFVKEHKKSPSLLALRLRFESKDKVLYENRIKHVLDDLETAHIDATAQVEIIQQANDVAIVRSFQEMSNSQSVLSMQADFEGKALLRELQRWSNSHMGVHEDRTLSIDEAVVELFMNSIHTDPDKEAIPCGIAAIDQWTVGGMRPGNLGLIAAPTGGGKSVALILMSYKMAMQGDHVWYITNEITAEQATKRFLARITQTSITDIMRDPGVIASKWQNTYRGTFGDRLRISEVSAGLSTEDLEGELIRSATLYGWMPRVICLDYMGRMQPNDDGFERSKEWIWYGAIASDLVQLAKKYDILVWSAIQTNRSGLTSDKIDMSQIQGSIQHLQEASLVVALKQVYGKTNEDGEEERGMLLSCLKNRHGPKGKDVTVAINLDKMDISNVEIEIIKDRKKGKKESDELAPIVPGAIDQ